MRAGGTLAKVRMNDVKLVGKPVSLGFDRRSGLARADAPKPASGELVAVAVATGRRPTSRKSLRRNLDVCGRGCQSLPRIAVFGGRHLANATREVALA